MKLHHYKQKCLHALVCGIKKMKAQKVDSLDIWADSVELVKEILLNNNNNQTEIITIILSRISLMI